MRARVDGIDLVNEPVPAPVPEELGLGLGRVHGFRAPSNSVKP